ncbi:MAG: FAD-binding oxidoreductase [bacterium]|nr:FAD-binding oxidoreductase [bacterium]
MTRRVPEGVATPGSVAEVANLVCCARREGIRLAIRGAGHSQGGQSLTDRGVVLDTSCLDRVQPAGPELVRAQGGARWGEVVDALKGTRRLPPILVDIGEATVGGTLAAGGIGTTSHRYGSQVEQVEQLEVVTGTGERVLCSPTQNAGLFDAVRAGQGQFGIITEAWIRLRPAGERFRQYELHYCDFERLAEDLDLLVESGRFDHLRVELRHRENLTVLLAGLEYDETPDDDRVLEALGHDELAYTRDTASVGRAGMYPSWAFSRLNYHPWRDWLLPWEALARLVAEPLLPPSSTPRRPWGWIGLYPMGRGEVEAPLFMRPPHKRLILYSVLAVIGEFEREKATDLAEKLEDIDRELVGLGAKSYLSGGVGYRPEQWEQHYGEMLKQGRMWKREFDPDHVFHLAEMPFGAGASDSDPRV